jgi:two-component system, NarL family, sensor histidine kinase UhpB
MQSSMLNSIGAQGERLGTSRLPAAGHAFEGALRNSYLHGTEVPPQVQALCELTPAAVCLTQRGVIVFANAAMARLCRLSTSKMLRGRCLSSLLGPAGQQALEEQTRRALKPLGGTDSTIAAVSSQPCTNIQSEIGVGIGADRDLNLVTAALPQLGEGVLHHVLTDTRPSKQSQLALERSRRELQALSANQVQAREAERRHIAREMHDELGQRLTALKMELASMGRLSAKSKNERVQAMMEMVDDTVASVRRIASDLRPLMLDDLGLNAAIEWLVRESTQRSGLRITHNLDETNLPAQQEASVGIAIFRITQEALTNVARHAQATEVHIELRRLEKTLHLRVRDNGKGLNALAEGHNQSHGLIGIRERVFSLGGQFEIGNSVLGGAQLTVLIPLGPPSQHDAWHVISQRQQSVRVPLDACEPHLGTSLTNNGADRGKKSHADHHADRSDGRRAEARV